MSSDDLIRIYVGADRSQSLAVAVLDHSIRRHTTAQVELVPMIDLPVPQPRDPRNAQRTGFSFSRFCIPKLAGYRGKAIYMDADMLVMRDIRNLWNIPFDGAKVIVQKEVKFEDTTIAKAGAPPSRKKQCAVMLLDCGRLDWAVEDIVASLDHGEYDYDELMSTLCILHDAEVNYGVPFEWNSLEYCDADTSLIHYTDMGTQPWVYTSNKFGQLWLDEVRLMLKNRKLTVDAVQEEIDLGYFRPSLLRDVRYRHRIPQRLRALWDQKNATRDALSGYVKHRSVYDAKRARQAAATSYQKAFDTKIPSPTTDEGEIT